VIAAVDFSHGAMRALTEGRRIARRAGMEFQVLHVTGPGTSWQPDNECAEWLRSVSVSQSAVFVRRGLAWVEIVRHASEVSAAMIVVGSHGASGAQRIRLGSTASRVAMNASCPVLFVSGRSESSMDSDPSSWSEP